MSWSRQVGYDLLPLRLVVGNAQRKVEFLHSQYEREMLLAGADYSNNLWLCVFTGQDPIPLYVIKALYNCGRSNIARGDYPFFFSCIPIAKYNFRLFEVPGHCRLEDFQITRLFLARSS